MDRKNLLIISLHASPSMPPGVNEWGGTHTYMRELLTDLSGSKYNIILVTRKVFPEEQDMEQVIPNGKILRLTLGSFEDFDKRNLYDLHEITLKQLITQLDHIEFKPDVIHSVYWNSGHLAMKLSRLWKIPYVHSVISNAIGRNLHGAQGTAEHRIHVEREVFLNASFIICVAESEKKEISKFYDTNKCKIIVAGQYVHPSFINPPHNKYGFPRKSGINCKIEALYFPVSSGKAYSTSDWWNRKAFTYTGRISTDKGLDVIIRAWFNLVKKYHEVCPPLWIIGGSPDDICVFRNSLNLGTLDLEALEESGKLVWWGYLDESGISAIYTRSLVLVTHSRYEPGGRVAVEAMCEGIPVIATPNGFALDVIKDWHNGFLVPFQNTEQLFVRMEHFIKQPYLTDVLGNNAQSSGKSIVNFWDFKNKHISAYEAAQKKQELIPDMFKTEAIKDSFITRQLETYPYNMMLVDNTDILELMQQNGIHDVLSINKVQMPNSSSVFWLVKTNRDEYLVKIPYDRLNKSALWAPKGEVPFVITGLKRYQAEIQALQYKGVPELVGYGKHRYALIRPKLTPCSIPEELQLTYAIKSIEKFYSNKVSHLSDLFFTINSLLKNGVSYEAIDEVYKSEIEKFNPKQCFFTDYSLRVELLRWKRYFNELSETSRKKIKPLFDISYEWAWTSASEEISLTPILVHGGCDLKNLIFIPNAVLLDNEKIHAGWPGLDFADLFITYTRKYSSRESENWWRWLFELIPTQMISKKILAVWIVLGAYKEAVSEEALLNPVSQDLVNRISIIQKLF